MDTEWKYPGERLLLDDLNDLTDYPIKWESGEQVVWEALPGQWGWVVYSNVGRNYLNCGNERMFYFSELAAQTVADALNLMHCAICGD